jgi:Flp pilus assembly protein protease CpaA
LAAFPFIVAAKPAQFTGDEDMNLSLNHRKALWRFGLLTPAMLAPVWHAWTSLVVPSAPLGNVLSCVLVPLLVVCTYTDLRWKIIPNFATYSSLLWALGLNSVASIAALGLSPAFAEQFSMHLGAIGIGPSLLGAAACFAIMFSFYTARGFGGGDIKLAAAIGALLGWQLGISVLFWCAVTAAVFGIASIARQIGPGALMCDVTRRLAFLLAPTCFAPPPARLEGLLHTPTPMALFFLIGATISLLGFTVL